MTISPLSSQLKHVFINAKHLRISLLFILILEIHGVFINQVQCQFQYQEAKSLLPLDKNPFSYSEYSESYSKYQKENQGELEITIPDSVQITKVSLFFKKINTQR
jgi:hypothetical protein